MPKINDNFGFYGILTDPDRGYEYVTKLLVDYEIPFIQLREKNKSDYEITKIAEMMHKITEGTNSNLIINDNPYIMKDVDADGVHIGPDDMSVEETRAIIGSDKIVGLSTHFPKQTEISRDLEIDYIGVGPVYATPTKEIADPVLGLNTMKEMVEISTVPAVCIGGVSLERIPDILSGGARNFSLVRPICSTMNPEKALKQIISLMK